MFYEGYISHSVPLLVLLIDFSYNCIPFLWRHFFISIPIASLYIVFVVFYSIFEKPVYHGFDLNTTEGILRTCGAILLTIFVQFILVTWYRTKLRRNNKNIALKQFKKATDALRYRKIVRE